MKGSHSFLGVLADGVNSVGGESGTGEGWPDNETLDAKAMERVGEIAEEPGMLADKTELSSEDGTWGELLSECNTKQQHCLPLMQKIGSL